MEHTRHWVVKLQFKPLDEYELGNAMSELSAGECKIPVHMVGSGVDEDGWLEARLTVRAEDRLHATLRAEHYVKGAYGVREPVYIVKVWK